MENNNFSIGTYSISSDGVSINYCAPSLLSKETLDKMIFETDEITEDREDENATIENLSIPKKG